MDESDPLPVPVLSEGGAGAFRAHERIGYLTDHRLDDAVGVKLAFSMRTGGSSEPPYSSLNLGLSVGDDPGAVASNRLALLGALGLSEYAPRLVNPVQIHGEKILALVGSEPEASRLEEGSRISGLDVFTYVGPPAAPLLDAMCDAVVCTLPGVPVLLCYADCVPVIIVAPDGSFAVVHSGWRGALRSLAGKAATALSMACGFPISDMNAYIGPHIGACCYVVSDELVDSFVSKFGIGCDATGRHLDLGYAVTASLRASGMDAEAIVSSRICVADDIARFYSHRAEGGRTGRFGALCCRR